MSLRSCLMLALLALSFVVALVSGGASFAEDVWDDEDEVPPIGYDSAGNPIKPEIKKELKTQ